ncbi:ABC transporter substrate-binding protein [Clostridium felsineum]|uniref:ABC transporter substrate-binding protein n=1 Tax=Clostridium felsineum TaxID=36839 RepID=UPI00214D89A4|nr:ABC transporter substrate-binding protein [Clostridium felsineum]MCR3761641.1 ABC transporter substrate-binding protein [Clostridium felsineum]
MYKKRNTLISTLLLIMMLILASCSNAQNENNSSANNSNVNKTNIASINYNGKTYISLKDAFKATGGNVSIKGNNVTATKDTDVIKLSTNNTTAYLNSSKISMSDLPKVKNKDVYVPMDFLTDILDAKITYSDGKVSLLEEVPLKYTKAFKIQYLKGGFKKITDGNNKVIILAPKGKAVPNIYKNNTIINYPTSNILVSSSTEAALLRPLDEIKSIKAVNLKEAEWEINDIKSALKDNKITYVGDTTSPDYEKISSLKPDLAILYGGNYGLNNMMKKFDELKIPYVADNEYLEEDPLGRLEWIKFLAAFYDKEDIAEKYFNSEVSKVKAIENKISSQKKTKVAFGMVDNGKVYVPAKDSYAAKMIALAGGDYIFKDLNTKSGYITLENFYAKAKDADVLIYSSSKEYTPSIKSVLNEAPVLKDTKPVKDKKVWCLGRDYYQATDKTSELIEDLASIFHPENFKGYKQKHYSHY